MKMKERDRRLADSEYMAALRHRFFLPSNMSGDDVYELCGDTYNAALVDFGLQWRRLVESIGDALAMPVRAATALCNWIKDKIAER